MSNAGVHQFVNFTTRDFNGCIDVGCVTKVVALPTLSYSPGSPDYVIGLLNLAGEIIPVIDLSMRLAVSAPEKYTINTPILICQNARQQKMGLVVDTVDDIKTVKDELIQYDVDNIDKRFVDGMIKLDGGIALIINIDSII